MLFPFLTLEISISSSFPRVCQAVTSSEWQKPAEVRPWRILLASSSALVYIFISMGQHLTCFKTGVSCVSVCVLRSSVSAFAFYCVSVLCVSVVLHKFCFSFKTCVLGSMRFGCNSYCWVCGCINCGQQSKQQAASKQQEASIAWMIAFFRAKAGRMLQAS